MSRQPPHTPPPRRHAPPSPRTSHPLYTPPWRRVTYPGLRWDGQPPTANEIHATREWLKRAEWDPTRRRDFIACRWSEMRANGVEDIESQLRRISADVAPLGGNPAEVLDALEFIHTHWTGGTCDA